jgi:hypothetical protein
MNGIFANYLWTTALGKRLLNFIVFGLTRSELEPTIYRTQGEHANHYTTDSVIMDLVLSLS